MKRNALYIFLTLLLATALTALAQSPTSSNTGGSETKDPYGATLDHPNPGTPNPSRDTAAVQPNDSAKVNEGMTPAPTTAAPSTSSSTTTDTTGSSMPATTTDTTNNVTPSKSLPRTASELPLLATIGLLALGGALTVRSIAKRSA
jgi:hypothetical protein